MNIEMYEKLDETESYHWWFKAKREIVLELANPFLMKSNNIKLADIGCGTGLMLHELEKYGSATGYDFSDIALSFCQKKCNAELFKLDLGDSFFSATTTYDMVFALDIIEHIKNDKVAMDNIFKVVEKNGHAIITTPAFQFLWSQNDINNMHYRRYSLKELQNLAEESGFIVEYISYYNFWLFIPIALIRIVTRIFRLDKHSNIEYGSGKGILNKLFYRIFVSEKNKISTHKVFPFGVSLIMLVTKEGKK